MYVKYFCILICAKTEYRIVTVRLSSLQYNIRKLRCINGIWKILCLETHSTGRSVYNAILAMLSGKLRCCIHLNARLIRKHRQRAPCLWFPADCRCDYLSLFMLQHKVMIISFTIIRAALIRYHIGTDHLKLPEIERCPIDIRKLSGWI